jgi:hypothetical protein
VRPIKAFDNPQLLPPLQHGGGTAATDPQKELENSDEILEASMFYLLGIWSHGIVMHPIMISGVTSYKANSSRQLLND